MVKNQDNLEISFTATADSLWENFEKTGSVTAFLKFCQKTELNKEVDAEFLPS